MVFEPGENQITTIIKIKKIMRENHTNMTSIDQLFKDQFDQAEIAFDPMAWEMLEQTKKKRRGFFFWFNGRKNILLFALIGLLVLPVAFLWIQNKSFETPAISSVVEEDKDHQGTIESGAKTEQNPQLSQIESTNANEKSNSPQESPQLSQLQENEFDKEVVENSTIDVEPVSGQDVSAIALSKEEEISALHSQLEQIKSEHDRVVRDLEATRLENDRYEKAFTEDGSKMDTTVK